MRIDIHLHVAQPPIEGVGEIREQLAAALEAIRRVQHQVNLSDVGFRRVQHQAYLDWQSIEAIQKKLGMPTTAPKRRPQRT